MRKALTQLAMAAALIGSGGVGDMPVKKYSGIKKTQMSRKAYRKRYTRNKMARKSRRINQLNSK